MQVVIASDFIIIIVIVVIIIIIIIVIIIIIIIINVPDHMMTSFTAGSSRDGDANLPDAFLDNKHEIVDDWRHVDTVSSRPHKVESAENIQGS